MIELHFDRTLYSGRAVDAAMARLQRFATFESQSDPGHWVVRVTARTAALEARVAGELGNFALGLTIERGGPDGDDGS